MANNLALSGEEESEEFEFFRSEHMVLLRMCIQADAAAANIDTLGGLGLVQFRNLNAKVIASQLKFKDNIKRLDEIERKLRFFNGQVIKDETVCIFPGTSHSESIDILEARFEDFEQEIIQMNERYVAMTKQFNEMVELKHVLSKASVIFHEANSNRMETFSGIPELEVNASLESPLLKSEGYTQNLRLGFVTGVILTEKIRPFERMCFRACRGNLYLKYTPIDDGEEKLIDPVSGETLSKSVFIAFFSGERSQNKINRIIDSFQAHAYSFPEDARKHAAMTAEVDSRLKDLKTVLSQTTEHRSLLLQKIANHLRTWDIRVRKEKAIYQTLNMCRPVNDSSSQCLIAEVWCPRNAKERIINALRDRNASIGAEVGTVIWELQSSVDPPTYFKVNKFTTAFQGIVEAYGVAGYREFNPTPFTIITFPFLFAVMFGDVGHGIIMLLVALYLILNERKLGELKLNEMVVMLFDGRYLLLLMAIFSVYTGLLYNETFSVPIDLFGTRWSLSHNSSIVPNKSEELAAQQAAGTYPFGLDPAWHGTSNELQFVNSMKMKLSIILGVTQMIWGIILSALNAVYFKKPLNLYCEFIPQMLFLCCTFGYLTIMIFLKWSINWVEQVKWTLPQVYSDPAPNGFTNCPVQPTAPTWDPVCGCWIGGCRPPSLVGMLISMFLKFSIMPEDQMFKGQELVQQLFVFIAFISVFWMLIPKPYFLNKWHQEEQARLGEGDNEAAHHAAEEAGGGGHDDHGPFDLSDAIVHQAIHTIEFVLGCVSNTASYLRLWALSLAHSQLSVVFWDKVMVMMFKLGDTQGVIVQMFGIFIGFSVWAAITIAVLMIMESLSAFLHALRLHWVEFQNKFYGASGVKFEPLSYAVLVAQEAEEAN